MGYVPRNLPREPKPVSNPRETFNFNFLPSPPPQSTVPILTQYSLLSGSRDKTLIQWNLTRDESSYGYPKRSLHGHSHIVSDVVSGGTEWTADAFTETFTLGHLL